MTCCQPLFLHPLPPFTLFTTAKTAKYIIRPLIAVTLTHPSTPLPPDSFQYCGPSLPLLLSGLLAWALSCFEVALFIQPAWDVAVCGGARGGRALFRWTKCQGLTSVKAKLCFSFKVFWTFVEVPIAAEVHHLKKSGHCGVCIRWLQEVTVWAVFSSQWIWRRHGLLIVKHNKLKKG